MMQNLRSKNLLYYLIETDDKFIKSKTTKIFKDSSLRLLLIVGMDSMYIVFRSPIDKKDYRVSYKDFIQIINIKDNFQIILN